MRRISSSMTVRIQALQENRYLSGLNDEILRHLAENTRLIVYDAGETIIHEGQSCQGLNIVESGRVKIYKYSSTGREMIINVLDKGESFNEVSVFDQKENPVNASAVLSTRTWLISADVLRKVIAEHPRASQQIIINLSKNLRMLVGKVAELSFYTVTARLARLLRELPEAQLAGSGPSRLTQDDLAARIGTVREVVARSLKELERVGAINIERGKITILNQDKLIDWE
ncbi:MAG: Crp/Fnr family transcriptional regulator [Anaerolineales bacterium]|nr:Crp/Fnr family transcriptional regulator [Anaerolineales bacterium]